MRGWLSRKKSRDAESSPDGGEAHLALAKESLRDLLSDTRVPEQVRAQLARDYEEVREMLEAHVAERRSVLEQIEAAWTRQTRRPTAAEVDAWIAAGRS